MFKLISKKLRKNNKGFTLVELVVVIAILGILAAVAVPKLTTSKKNAAKIAHNANVRTLMNAANLFIAEYGVPSDTVTWEPGGGAKASDINDTSKDNNKWALYLQEWPVIPEGLDYDDLDLAEDAELEYEVTIYENGTITVTPQLKYEDLEKVS